MNLNKVIIVGRLTQAPDKKTLPNSGNDVTSFGMATNTYFNDKSGQRQERTEFHNIVLYGSVADIAARYLNKGSIVLIEGRIQTRSWDDKDGNKRYKTEIVGERIQLGPRESSGGEKDNYKSSTNNSKNSEKEIPVIDEDEEIDVEDIPF